MAWLRYRCVVLALLWEGTALPATARATDIPVTTTVDSMSADGHCSLREALWAANNASPINADCPAGGGAARILLGATTYPIQLTSSNEDLGNDGDFESCGARRTASRA
jgi:CSLREA domain-containing protein